MRRRVEETLDLLGIADLRDRDLRTLSGGQQQRVAIGSVLTMHPRLLVLDEPTSALDPTAAEEVLATLTRLVHDLGVSVLLAEHRLERVVPFADRICLLDGDGRLGSVSRRTVLAQVARRYRRWSSWAGRPAGPAAADRARAPGDSRAAPAVARRASGEPPAAASPRWSPTGVMSCTAGRSRCARSRLTLPQGGSRR